MFFLAAGHTTSIPSTEDIMDTCKWPTFSPQSAQFQYCCAEFCSLLNAKCTLDNDDGPWTMASRAWRGIFFNPGTIVQRQGTDEFYISFGLIGLLLVALWKVLKVDLPGAKTVYIVGTKLASCNNNLPTWISPLELDEFDGIKTQVISPIHFWLLSNKKRHLHHGIVLLEVEPPQPLIVMAAQACFYDMNMAKLKTLCAEKELEPTTPDLLGHIEVLVHEILPHLSPDDVNKILEQRCEVPVDPLQELVPDDDVRAAMFPDEDAKHLKDKHVLLYMLKLSESYFSYNFKLGPQEADGCSSR